MRSSLMIFARSAGLATRLLKKSASKSLGVHWLSTSANDGKKMTSSLAGDDLRSVNVTINVNSQKVTLDAIVQDTMPSGSSVGTVVAVHGVPGSHKDFKYLLPPLKDAGIRLIGVNFPGFGYTLNSSALQQTNQERSDYVQAIVDQLGLSRKLVFMGHSRGSENALRMAVRNPNDCVGAMLVNPIGLRPHRGIRPLSVVNAITFLWNLGSIAQFFLRPFLLWFYNSVLKFRVPTGDQAALCIQLVTNAELASQLPVIKELNDRRDMAVVLAYGGSDPLIETEVSREFADAFHTGPEIVCHADGHDDSVASQELDTLLRNGHTKVAVRFDKENHFLQKHRAVFLVDAIRSMLARSQ
uniref:AB hydrolase-1 domain-containing protein n=1 Tax=Plectus sambesii TaxID=2011161 RepID=A0A914V9Y9_9BILA